MASGIYRIYSKATDESYYGSSNNMQRRFIEHRYLWKNNKGNHKIRLLLNIYGIDNFMFEIIEKCDPIEFKYKEKSYIDRDHNNLNVWIDPSSPRGCKLGNNVKAKHFKGRPHTEESNIKFIKIIKEYCERNGGSYWKGKSIPQEMRNKVSDGLKRYYSNNPHPRK